MSRLVWHDQTLNTAIRRQCSDEQLEQIACMLSKLGIKQADIWLADWQQYCPDLSGAKKHLELRAITSLTQPELELSQQLGMSGVALVCNLAQQDNFNLSLASVIHEADRRSLQSSIQLEGVSALSTPELAVIAAQINEYDIASIIYDDRMAKGDPLSIFEQLTFIIRKVNCPVEVCLGNTYGLATANSLAAVKAGITHLATSVVGVGGYTPWEEVVFIVKQLLDFDCELSQHVANICRQVAAVLELDVPENKPVIGDAVFSCKSGVHVAGVIEELELCEPLSSELTGWKRRLVIGNHSGSTVIKPKYYDWGGQPAFSVQKKAGISDGELRQLYQSS